MMSISLLNLGLRRPGYMLTKTVPDLCHGETTWDLSGSEEWRVVQIEMASELSHAVTF
jgi:hypothetical protein